MKRLLPLLLLVPLAAYFLWPTAKPAVDDPTFDEQMFGAVADNLVSCWKMDEASGNASDGYAANTLTNVNSTPYVAGKINNGADLESASTQYFSVAHASQSGLALTGSFSFAGWYKLESVPSTDNRFGLVAKGSAEALNSSRYIWQVQDDANTDYLLLYLDNGASGTSNLRVAWTHVTGSYVHLAVTYNLAAGTAKFYVNGSQQGVNQTGGVTALNNGETDPFLLGAYEINTTKVSLFDGVMDEVGVWARELSAAEITSLYNGGSGLACPFGFSAAPLPDNSYFDIID